MKLFAHPNSSGRSWKTACFVLLGPSTEAIFPSSNKVRTNTPNYKTDMCPLYDKMNLVHWNSDEPTEEHKRKIRNSRKKNNNINNILIFINSCVSLRSMNFVSFSLLPIIFIFFSLFLRTYNVDIHTVLWFNAFPAPLHKQQQQRQQLWLFNVHCYTNSFGYEIFGTNELCTQGLSNKVRKMECKNISINSNRFCYFAFGIFAPYASCIRANGIRHSSLLPFVIALQVDHGRVCFAIFSTFFRHLFILTSYITEYYLFFLPPQTVHCFFCIVRVLHSLPCKFNH